MNSGKIMVSFLRYGDCFFWDGHLWIHCGWCYAPHHICGLGIYTGEHRVVPNSAMVDLREEWFSHGLGI